MDTSDSLWGKKLPICTQRTAFLAYFGIIEGIFIVFKYPKWMVFYTSSVSDSPNQFFWLKNGRFCPENGGFFGDFWMIEGIYLLFLYPKWMKIRSIIRVNEDKKKFQTPPTHFLAENCFFLPQKACYFFCGSWGLYVRTFPVRKTDGHE